MITSYRAYQPDAANPTHPPTRQHRECFLDILCEEGGDFLLEESCEAGVRTWEASKGAWRTQPVALMHLRRAAGGDTVGVKLRRPDES